MLVADEIVSENVRFRGSMGSTLEGLEAFKDLLISAQTSKPRILAA